MFIKVLERKKILDSPDLRKIHKLDTPSLGGIPIAIGVIIAILLWFPREMALEYKYLFSALTLAFIIGIRDDLIPLRPSFKLFSQMIPALMIILLQDTFLTSFYGLSTIEFPYEVSAIITLFSIVVITNSFNLIDGIDGLAGSISLFVICFLGIWFYLVSYSSLAFISFAFSGALVGFLFYNWNPSKIFMGDTGALLLGFFQAFLVIQFININYGLPDSSFYKFNSSISTAIAILIIPLLDTLRVFILRAIQKKSPFAADTNHLHHILLKMGCNHSQAVITLLLVTIIFVVIAVLLRNASPWISLTSLLMTAIIFVSILSILIKAQSKKT